MGGRIILLSLVRTWSRCMDHIYIDTIAFRRRSHGRTTIFSWHVPYNTSDPSCDVQVNGIRINRGLDIKIQPTSAYVVSAWYDPPMIRERKHESKSAVWWVGSTKLHQRAHIEHLLSVAQTFPSSFPRPDPSTVQLLYGTQRPFGVAVNAGVVEHKRRILNVEMQCPDVVGETTAALAQFIVKDVVQIVIDFLRVDSDPQLQVRPLIRTDVGPLHALPPIGMQIRPAFGFKFASLPITGVMTTACFNLGGAILQGVVLSIRAPNQINVWIRLGDDWTQLAKHQTTASASSSSSPPRCLYSLSDNMRCSPVFRVVLTIGTKPPIRTSPRYTAYVTFRLMCTRLIDDSKNSDEIT